MKIRKISISELKTAYEIDESVFHPMNYPLFVIRQYFDLFSDYFFVAENQEKEIIGYTIGGINILEKKGWILALATKKGFRKQGVGLELTKTLVNEINNFGINHIDLTVEPNNSAISIYEKIGFKTRESEQNYYGNNTPRMIMELIKSC